MTSAERLERIEKLKQLASVYQKLKGTRKLTAPEAHEYIDILDELERVQRIEDGFQDIMVFAKNYFQGTPPHDLLKPDTPSPPFHYEVVSYLREAVLDPMERKVAIAAPRSHAKSCLVTNIFPIWCVCYVDDVKERYWVIIGDKQDNARKFLDVIKSEFEDNDLLKADFGNLKGSTWNALEIITANNVKISAHGAGEGLRGLRYGSARPSVIMDDIESDESCSTPDRIAKMMDWFERTVLPLGDPMHSKFFLVGTIIHYNSLLSQVMRDKPEWKHFKYKAVMTFPERMDLWKEWEDLFHNRDEGNSPEEASRIARTKAMALYAEHREEMEYGAEVLWPERMSLIKLMEKRAEKRLAFNSEYMNEPIDEDTRIFHTIHYFKMSDIKLDECEIFGACDPSMGQSKRSDPSAIVTIARDKRGILYVIEADAKRRHPDQIIQDIFRKAKMLPYKMFSIESTAFQQFMKDEVIKRSAEQGVYLPVKEFKSNVRKELRIAAIEPLVSTGQVRFLESQRDLIEQMEYFPKSANDDLIDACSQCLELAKKSAGSFIFSHI